MRRRFFQTILILIIMNIVWVNAVLDRLLPAYVPADGNRFWAFLILRFFIYGVLLALFVTLEILPCYEKGLNFRLELLAGGYEIILVSVYVLMTEIILLSLAVWRLDVFGHPETSSLFWVNLVVAWFVLLFHYLNGFWRTAFCSSQLGIGRRIVMFFCWWIFPVNLFLFYGWCRVVRRELITARNRYLLDAARVENAVCRTRYPVVMVHGIFFRDWQYMNYWGRIPRTLKRNGALVYYGKQQSALSVADSAAELKTELERVLEKTGAEKVNIIAHSKGGLDARYAISRLGMANVVASLTTINTPHRGCRFVDSLLSSLPDWLVHIAEKRYNSLFSVLGDEKPDFLAGVKDLTAEACARFNEEVTDAPQVYYQSVMSKMDNFGSAFFLLGISYLLAKKYEGENDGLVSVSSARWGNYLGLLTAGRKGISHADMIDLTHKDIKGFDVSEFYVKLFAGLKEKGF